MKRELALALVIGVFTFLIGLLLPWMVAQADDLAATMTPIYAPLDFLRVETSQPLSIRPGQVIVIGAGDRISTGRDSRAILDFNGLFQILLFPESRLSLHEFGFEDGAARFDATLIGRASTRITAGTRFSRYQLAAGAFTITQPADVFGVWAVEGERQYVMVAAGEAEVAGQTLPVPAGSGLRSSTEGLLLIEVPQTDYINPARLEATRASCTAQVNTVDDLNLTVRFGPGSGFSAIGYIRNNQEITLVAVNENGNRYRVQRFAGFGWVEDGGLILGVGCDRLPVLPNLFSESNEQFLVVEERELPFLTPFYGPSTENLWFYRLLDSFIPPLS
jgi:hypothetical protein